MSVKTGTGAFIVSVSFCIMVCAMGFTLHDEAKSPHTSVHHVVSVCTCTTVSALLSEDFAKSDLHSLDASSPNQLVGTYNS